MMFRETFTFDDVLIVPQLSTLISRSEVDLSVSLSKGLKFNIPVTPANMKTVVNEKIAREFYKLKGLCLLHRFMSMGEQVEILANIRNDYADAFNYIGVSVGVKEEDRANISRFVSLGVKIICVDVAHGHSSNCANMVYWIAKKYPEVFLIAGNVATGSGAKYLWEAGTDAVKANIGSGSTCRTRVETGVGVPALSCLMDIDNVRRSLKRTDKFVIADGGCSKTGDLVKSLCFSDLVMTGNLFAGSIDFDSDNADKEYRRYDGSSTHKDDHIEGVKALVAIKPPIKDIVKKMKDGISSACSYVGASNLLQLKEKATFVKVSSHTVRENDAHDVIVMKEDGQ